MTDLKLKVGDEGTVCGVTMQLSPEHFAACTDKQLMEVWMKPAMEQLIRASRDFLGKGSK